ncbi:MAG: MraY family glycosyltransferase, partial [Bacteroidota bacterium]
MGIRNTGEAVIRWSATSKPSLGGISFFIVFLFSVIWVSFLRNGDSEFFNLQTLGLIVAVIIGFLLGLFDDAYNTKPWIKFFTQIMCGVILIVTGTYIEIFENNFFNYALTVFWVVGMMNSINMLDNMDGITTIVSFSILLSFLLSIILGSEFRNPYMIIISGVMASLAGFIFYNWYPSKMYMGDTGSQFLGIFLASLGIQFLWNNDFGSSETFLMQQLLSVLIVFAL